MAEQTTLPTDVTPRPRGSESLNLTTLTSSDRLWLEQVGITWPVPEEEAEWLDQQNELIKTGSGHLRGAQPEVADDILVARELFLDQLVSLDEDVRRNLKDHSVSSVPTNTMVGSLKFLISQGIDAVKAVNTLQSILGFSKEALKARLDNLNVLGIDAKKAINFSPTLLSSTPEIVRSRLSNLEAHSFNAVKIANIYPPILGMGIDTVNERLSSLKAMGIEIEKCINVYPNLVALKSESIVAKIDNLTAHGIDALKVINKAPGILGHRTDSINLKLDNLVAQGLEPVRVVNKIPSALAMAIDSVNDKLDNLATHGFNVTKIVNSFPELLAFSQETINAKIDNLVKQGLDPTKVVEGAPSSMGFNSDTLNAKLRVLHAAARTWKLEDGTTLVNQIVERWPIILTYKPTKLRTLIRIASQTLPNSAKNEFTLKNIQTAVITNLEQVIVAYLESKDEIKNPADIGRLAFRNRKVAKETLKNVIAEHPDDPVVKTYLKGYKF